MSSVQRYEYFIFLTLSIVLVQTLAEILSEREMISHLMEKIIDEATRPWGVKVERVEIKVTFSARALEAGEVERFVSPSPHNLYHGFSTTHTHTHTPHTYYV